LSSENPGDRNLRTRLIQAYRLAKRSDDALKLLNAALNQNPKDADALLQRGEIQILAGNVEQARQDATAVLYSLPDSAEAHFLLSQVHRATGNVRNRRQELIEALRLNPNLLAIRVELAQSYIQANSPAYAIRLLDQAPSSQTNTMPIIVQRNWALLAAGDFSASRRNIDDGLKLGRSRDLLLQDAILNIVTRDLSGARNRLEEILKQAPQDTTAVELLAVTYNGLKQSSVALEKVRFYAAQRPESAPMQMILGRYLLANGKREEARVAFLAAKAANPNFTPADIALAQLDRAAGKTEAARNTLLAVLASKQIHPESELIARLVMGDLEGAEGNRAAEIEQWRKVVAADSRNIFALNNLAYSLLEYAKQPDEALKYAQRAAELAPDNPDVQDTMGWVYYRKGIYATAAEHLQHAVAADGKVAAPNAIVRKYHLAMACLKSGDRNRGLQALEAALKLNPNLPEAEMAQAVLAQSR